MAWYSKRGGKSVLTTWFLWDFFLGVFVKVREFSTVIYPSTQKYFHPKGKLRLRNFEHLHENSYCFVGNLIEILLFQQKYRILLKRVIFRFLQSLFSWWYSSLMPHLSTPSAVLPLAVKKCSTCIEIFFNTLDFLKHHYLRELFRSSIEFFFNIIFRHIIMAIHITYRSRCVSL